jgi:hypothetical protein
MNYPRMALAAVVALVAYMAIGTVLFAVLPYLKQEYMKYPAVYRNQQGQLSHMPFGTLGMLLSIVALVVLYAWTFRPGFGVREGLLFGVLIGIYSVGSFVLHNFVNLNIGMRLTAYSSLAYLLEWTVVGAVIGLLYRPLP